ncbi:DUF4783 domain-containing protein [Daejeonella sp.]|uniref:DUF4783 domain-containing protein n=1 Tax=Daejeonella sp. TaxID=2805397 RepID=UPI003983D6C7
MRTRLLHIFLPLLFAISPASAQQVDVIDLLAKYFNTADAPKIASLFSSTLELDILSEENLYSKAQAELIMRDFFSKNKPVSLKIIHRLSSNPSYKLAVFLVSTSKDKFRVSISLSGNDEAFLIKQIRIEHDRLQQF